MLRPIEHTDTVYLNLYVLFYAIPYLWHRFTYYAIIYLSWFFLTLAILSPFYLRPTKTGWYIMACIVGVMVLCGVISNESIFAWLRG